MTPFKDSEKQKAYMREYQHKQRELLKQFKKLQEKEAKQTTRKPKTVNP